MKKEYILTFCISFLVLLTVVIISLMILLPQQTTVTLNKIEEYASIKKSDYLFTQTNALSFESLVKEYNISDDKLKEFKYNNQYIAGNSDPFSSIVNGTLGVRYESYSETVKGIVPDEIDDDDNDDDRKVGGKG